MRLLLKLVVSLLLLCTFGCSESQDSQTAVPAPKVQPPPQFVMTDDPKVFFENYVRDLTGGTYLPDELVTEMEGSTSLVHARALISNHHTIAFIEWYFSSAYLAKVNDLVTEKVKRMDYQLNVLDIPATIAEEVLLVVDAGPLTHRVVFLEGDVQQQWQKKDDQTYELTLSQGRWTHPLRIVKEGDAWKIELTDL